MASQGELVVPREEVVRFIADCMRKAGAGTEDARAVAQHLMTADYRGHFSHGLNRAQMYVNDIRHKLTDATAKPKIVNDFQVRGGRCSGGCCGGENDVECGIIAGMVDGGLQAGALRDVEILK